MSPLNRLWATEWLPSRFLLADRFDNALQRLSIRNLLMYPLVSRKIIAPSSGGAMWTLPLDVHESASSCACELTQNR
jgi:hypothetical protein